MKKLFLMITLLSLTSSVIFGENNNDNSSSSQIDEKGIHDLLIDEHNEAILGVDEAFNSEKKPSDNIKLTDDEDDNDNAPLDQEFFDEKGFGDDLDWSNNVNPWPNPVINSEEIKAIEGSSNKGLENENLSLGSTSKEITQLEEVSE